MDQLKKPNSRKRKTHFPIVTTTNSPVVVTILKSDVEKDEQLLRHILNMLDNHMLLKKHIKDHM